MISNGRGEGGSGKHGLIPLELTGPSIKFPSALSPSKINKPALHISPRKFRPNFVADV